MDFVELTSMSGTRMLFNVYSIVGLIEENNKDKDGCVTGIVLEGKSTGVFGTSEKYDAVVKKLQEKIGV